MVPPPLTRAATGLLTGLLVLLCAPSTLAQTDADDALQAFLRGDLVLMVRHALAPGTGDPAGFRLEDCTTQRNLDEQGRAQARAMGNWLRGRGVSRTRVLSSQWCRCLETARLMDIGPVRELPALNSFYELPQDREPNLRALRDFLGARHARGVPTVLVTHQVAISELTGAGLAPGEGVLVAIEDGERYPVRARLRFGPSPQSSGSAAPSLVGIR